MPASRNGGTTISTASIFDQDTTGEAIQLLLDDPSGRIEHRPGFLDVATAAQWFDALHDDIAWRGERRMMYQRELDVPRLLAHYRLDDPALPVLLGDAANRVRVALGVDFNSVGLNLYRDGHDSVAPHNDRLTDIAEDKPIALISLGATRTMVIREKQPPRHVLHVDLESGSLLVMDYLSQIHYDHGIPKEKVKVGPRISLAFRVRRKAFPL